MSVKTIYKCDKCGGIQESKEQFWQIAVTLTSYGLHVSSSNINKSMHACRKCVIDLGLLPPPDKQAPTAPPPLTIEDLIIEIVQQAVVDANEYK